jgi:hypothetical protein
MQWDSCLESSSNKTLSRPSPPLPSQSAYCRQHTTKSQGVVGPAGTQMSTFNWEPSRLHPDLCIVSDCVRLTPDLCLRSIPLQPAPWVSLMRCVSVGRMHLLVTPSCSHTLLLLLDIGKDLAPVCDGISQGWRSGVSLTHSNWDQWLGLNLEDS